MKSPYKAHSKSSCGHQSNPNGFWESTLLEQDIMAKREESHGAGFAESQARTSHFLW